ncbi:hypothetical protein Tco_1508842 [Tanacetum coccineum]
MITLSLHLEQLSQIKDDAPEEINTFLKNITVLLQALVFIRLAFDNAVQNLGFKDMTSGQISSGLDLTYAPSTIATQKPTERELDLLFEAMYDDYIGGQPSFATRTVAAAQAP